jgi:hypothetical protein
MRGRDRITFDLIKYIQLLALIHHVSHWRAFRTMSKVVTLIPLHALATSRYCADKRDGLRL